MANRWFQLHSENQGARIVVGGISLFAVGDGEDGVLQYSGVVGQAMQVIQLQLWQLIQRFLAGPRRKLNLWILHAIAAHPRETLHVTLGHSLPDHFTREQVSAFTHGMAYRWRIQEFDGFARNRTRILERDQRATAIV